MLEVVVNMLKELGEDVSYMMVREELHVIIEDFDGFDEDWQEVDREYNVEAVEGFVEWLEAQAQQVEGDYYVRYRLQGVAVCVGYASYDI